MDREPKSTDLKPDNWIKRKFCPKIKEFPKKPLTAEQKKRLKETTWDDCRKAYVSRLSQGLLSDFEDKRDLVSEAFLAMDAILERFDVSYYEGKIAEFDVTGPTNPKTLEFFFVAYFQGRVNFIACESRSHKKTHNAGTSQELVPYDPKSESFGFGVEEEYEITGNLKYELSKRSSEFQRFFIKNVAQEIPYKDLVDEYGQEKCRELKEELQEFRDMLPRKYVVDYGMSRKKAKERKKRKLQVAKV